MPKDPKYVRLTQENRSGSAHDLVTGWSIGGYDVQKFPSDERSADYVRNLISNRRLEAASEEEFELVHGKSNWSTPEGKTHQESDMREQAAKVRGELDERRLDDYASSDYTSEEGRKESPRRKTEEPDEDEEPEDDRDNEEPIYLDDLDPAQLRALAKKDGVKVPPRASKETLVKLLSDK